jgi:hypothetical protein
LLQHVGVNSAVDSQHVADVILVCIRYHDSIFSWLYPCYGLQVLLAAGGHSLVQQHHAAARFISPVLQAPAVPHLAVIFAGYADIM